MTAKSNKLKLFLAFLLILIVFLCTSIYFSNAQEDDLEKETVEEASAEESSSGEPEEQKDDIEEIDKTDVLKGHVTKVPGGTKLKIIVETPIFEDSNKVGDEFSSRTLEDVIVDGEVVVPAGSNVNGVISEVNTAKRFHKAGSIRIDFKNLTTKDGKQIPIVASVLSRSGLIKGRYSPKRALIATATIAGPTVAGLGAGIAAEGSVVGAAAGAALGALAGTVLFFYQKGNKVDIKSGDELSIELTEDALIPEESELIKELKPDGQDDEGVEVKELDFTGESLNTGERKEEKNEEIEEDE